jgi:prepilin signal peptidase PulO-like enzyme (type II secretory pathway)
MIVAAIAILGLLTGSFVNALVWRLHEQEEGSSKPKKHKTPDADKLSIVHGRSMCPHCEHTLGFWDLLPVFSWLALHGRCRYCNKPISWQYPLVELMTAGLFAVSYLSWPLAFDVQGKILLVFWLISLIGLVALVIYDLKWYLLPNRIVFPLLALAILKCLYQLAVSTDRMGTLLDICFSVLIAGGLFYGLFVISKEKWIGGGDVKLGLLLGLILASPMSSFMMLFGSSLLGTLVSLPLLITSKVKRDSHIPYGPFLIAAAYIVMLYGPGLVNWYENLLG